MNDKDKNFLKIYDIKQFLFSKFPEGHLMKVTIQKVKDGFLGLGTKYIISTTYNNNYLFSIVKDGRNCFIFSMIKDKIRQKNQEYLGKLQSNSQHTQYILYNKNQKFNYNQIAHIKYKQSQSSRKIEAIISTNDKGFFSTQKNSNILNQKWKKYDRNRLSKLYSLQSQTDPTNDCYKPDFKLISSKTSAKNFILNNQSNSCLLFEPKSENIFNIKMANPLSIIQTVAICISNIQNFNNYPRKKKEQQQSKNSQNKAQQKPNISIFTDFTFSSLSCLQNVSFLPSFIWQKSQKKPVLKYEQTTTEQQQSLLKEL